MNRPRPRFPDLPALVCLRLLLLPVLLLISHPQYAPAQAATPEPDVFQAASQAYQEGRFEDAARLFQQLAHAAPAPGSLQNLGNALWQLGRTGPAIRAWEQALWLDPFHQPSRNNLAFARRTAQVESPQLKWYEVVSTWLPLSWWAVIAGISLWVAVGIALLPSILRWPKASWHQAVAAFALAIFLLSLPAHAGVSTRSKLGFVLQNSTPLRLTPTEESQSMTYLGGGDPARILRQRGPFLLVRTARSQGWIKAEEFGLISPR